jgi:hypothetical protein
LTFLFFSGYDAKRAVQSNTKTGGKNMERDTNADEKDAQKKEKRGRRRYRAVSKTSITVRLFNGSKIHIEKVVRELKGANVNFASESAAVRYYVSLGIDAETATSDLRNSLDNSIVKESIDGAMGKKLNPLKESIVRIDQALKNFTAENARIFTDVAKRTADIEAKLDTGFENTSATLEKLLLTGDNSFKNIAVLRSLFYIFLLGIQTGKINQGKDNLDQWNNIVRIAHEKAGEFAAQELRELSTGRMESDVIKNLTLQIFTHVKNATIVREEPTRTTRIIKEQNAAENVIL